MEFVNAKIYIANYLPNLEIDKNTSTYCQKHNSYIFAAGRNEGTPYPLENTREGGDIGLFITLVLKVL